MKTHRIVALVLAVIGAGAVFVFLAPTLMTNAMIHLFVRSRTDVVRNSKDIEDALVSFKRQNSSLSGSHLIFKISRRPNVIWHWYGNWKGFGWSSSWEEADRTIEFFEVGGDKLVYSIPVRMREDEGAGPPVVEITTNVAPLISGQETYSTSEGDYARLMDFLTKMTPDVTLHCTVSKDSMGRTVKDTEYLDGSLSMPQDKWADFVQRLFRDVYQSNQPIYREQLQFR